MKNFFESLNYPIILYVLYVAKSIILPSGYVDAVIIALLGIFYLTKYITDRYLETKEKVISENMFRAQVNEDIGKLATELNSLKLTTANPIQSAFRKR